MVTMLNKLFSKKKRTQNWKKLMVEIREAKKDPQFMKELKQFIKATSS
jgi:hypothetical protein